MKNEKENFNKNENLTQDPAVKKFIFDILSQVKNLPEEKQEEIVFSNFKKIGINVKKAQNGEWEIMEETSPLENKISLGAEEILANNASHSDIDGEENKDENDEKIIQDFIDDLIKQVEHLPGKEKGDGIIKILNEKYKLGIETLERGDLAVAGIIEQEVIKDEKELKEVEIVMKEDKDRLPIFPEISQKEKPEKETKIKNYLMELATRHNNGLKIPQKAKRWAKKAIIILGIFGAGLATAFGVKEIISNISEKGEIAKDKDRIGLSTSIKKEALERLSENCKKAVEDFKKNNPTPGRWFIVTDKDSAKDFIFDEKYELQKVIKIGLGKTLGEDNNTSYQLHQGDMTTPAGIYIMVAATLPINKKIYASSIGLYGISTKGDKIVLGMHEYYAGEREARIEAINNPNNEERVKTARVSDGCINSSEKDMDFIFKHFTIDSDSIMGLKIILPDWGKPIDLDKIMPEIKKTMEKLKTQHN